MGEDEDRGLENPLTLDNFQVEGPRVDPEAVGKFRSEDDFTALAVELFKEIAARTAVLACTHRLDDNNMPRKWNRNEAILGGLMIRLAKLQAGLLDAICQDRFEISEILARCLAETVLNIRFLLVAKSDAIYDQYIEYSLREEKRLLQLINENVGARGHELPIEFRMTRSIMRSFQIAGLAPEDVDEKRRNPWGGNLFKKAKHLGLDRAYLGLIGQPSHAVHGNWQDLITCHLTVSGDGFLPQPLWKPARPHLALGATVLSCNTCVWYLEAVLPECEDREKMSQQLEDCHARVSRLRELHEAFIQASGRTGVCRPAPDSSLRSE